LSLRLVEEMLLERGIVVSYETIRRWGNKFGLAYAHRLRRKQPSRDDIWRLDEVVITITGQNTGYGALGEIRTPDPRNRNPMLYPAELRVRAAPP
jgi:hypothetical protein